MALVSQSLDTPEAARNGAQLVLNEASGHRVLSGDEKAAALLLALGPDFGKPISTSWTSSRSSN